MNHIGVERFDCADDRLCDSCVSDCCVVERAVRFHVLKFASRRECRERSRLVSDRVAHLIGRQVHVPAPEPGEVRISRVRADSHPVLDRQRNRSGHPVGITGMEPRGNVGRRDVLDDF